MPSRPASPSRLLASGRLAFGLAAALVLLVAAGAAAEDAKAPADDTKAPAPSADPVQDGEKFGLNESQRKGVFVALADAEDRAEREAAQKFEADPDTEGQVALTDRLLRRYRAAIGKAHGLTDEQLAEIQAEGFQKHWKVVLP